jgi:hypothetical protein
VVTEERGEMEETASGLPVDRDGHTEDPEDHLGEELPDPWGDGLNHDWLALDDAPKEVTSE